MPIKCFFGDYSSHENEKKMLEKFLSQLVPVYGDNSNRWIYVIYNAMWSGQEVDLVCITQDSIIVADFKNYSGSLVGQENGEWMMTNLQGETLPVKGGGQINPFVQVRKNKYAVMEWLKSESMLVSDNIGHMAGLILFTEIKEAQIKLSHGVSQWFHVSDIPHIGRHLPSYCSKEINIAQSEAQEIVDALHLQAYEWTPVPPITAQYHPFDDIGTEKASTADYAALSRKSSGLPQPAIKIPTRLKSVYLPVAAMLVLTAGLGYGFIQGIQKSNSLVSKAVDAVVPDIVGDVIALTGVDTYKEFKNRPEDLTAFGPNPNEITYIKDGEHLWTTFQLIDLRKNTIYGMKIGETTFKEVEALKLNNDTAFLGDDKPKVVPGKVRNISQIVMIHGGLSDEGQKELMTYHPNFPQFRIDGLECVNTYFGADGIVRGVGFFFDNHSNEEILPYMRRYKSLGYQVLEGHISKRLGHSYAVLQKGDEIVTMNMDHGVGLSIIHTNQTTYNQYRHTLVIQDAYPTIPNPLKTNRRV